MVFSSGVVQIRLDRFTVNRENIAIDTCCQANTCSCGIRMRACVFDRNDTRCDDSSLQTSDLIGEYLALSFVASQHAVNVSGESSCFDICCGDLPVTSRVSHLALSFVASQHAGDVSGESSCFVICCITTCQ